MSGSGISWAICKSAPRSSPTTTPAVAQHPTTLFLQAGCPSCRPTNSVKALKALFATVSKCFSMAPHTRSHRAPCSCFPKKVSLQLSSEQSVGDVGITQLDWKRVPQARSGGCKSSVAMSRNFQHVLRNILSDHRTNAYNCLCSC